MSLPTELLIEMAHGIGADGDKHAGYGWLAVCTIGMLCSLTFYGIVLEYATSGGRKIHEISFLFITTSIYAITGFMTREFMGHKPATEISKYQTLTLSLTSIASTFTSVRSLRYVIYPVQILFKSCKPVPVMIFGVVLGKKYSIRKYVNVIIITVGVALFMGGGSSSAKPGGSDNTLIGALLLSISLCFDGATGAYEDKLMSEHEVSPFDLMYNIQLGKSIISFCTLVVMNGINELLHTIDTGGLSLVALGFTGAVGQVFLFLTISKFGALNCALIGLFRKMLSLVLSFVLYGHTLNAFQTVGLVLSLIAMIANFYEKGGSSHGHGGGHGSADAHKHQQSSGRPEDAETAPLVLEDDEGDIELAHQEEGQEEEEEAEGQLDAALAPTEIELIQFDTPVAPVKDLIELNPV